MAGVFTHNGNIVEGLPSTANMINYDNTSSGMQATQLQAAVDELNTNKQPKTDNNLATTDKTVTGSINELKSGLTDLSDHVDGDAVTYPYADVITIEDAVPSNLADCSVKIEPVQDLHGYDKPWVGGAGKNKFNLDLTTQTVSDVTITVNEDGTFSTNGTASADININILGYADTDAGNTYKLNGCPSGGGDNTYKLVACDNGGGAWYSDTGEGVSDISSDRVKKVKLFIASGTNVSGKTFKPMVYLNSESDATFSPYTNICPISGHTEVDVQRDGRNRLSVNSYSGSGSWLPSTTIAVTGNYLYRRVNFTTTGGGYTFSVYGIKNGVETAIDTSGYAGDLSGYNDVSAYDYVRVSGYSNNASNVLSDIMLCFNDNNTDTIAFEPYQGKTYTIALGSTIYGGTVDFNSGVMTVDMAYAEFNGTENWQGGTALTNTYRMVLDIAAISSVDEISNYLPRVNNYALDEPHFYIYNSKLYVFLPVSNETEFDAYLSSNNLQVCYELATPTTIQLTPQQIQLLQGTNTLTASTGQISVTVNGVSGAIGSVQEQVNDIAEDVALKQNATDNNLQTTDKTIVGGINEVKSGLNNKVLGFDDNQLTACNIISFVHYTDDNAYNVWTSHSYSIQEFTKIISVHLSVVNSDPTQFRHEVELTGISNNLFTYAVKGGWSGGISGVNVICTVIGI